MQERYTLTSLTESKPISNEAQRLPSEEYRRRRPGSREIVGYDSVKVLEAWAIYHVTYTITSIP